MPAVQLCYVHSYGRSLAQRKRERPPLMLRGRNIEHDCRPSKMIDRTVYSSSIIVVYVYLGASIFSCYSIAGTTFILCLIRSVHCSCNRAMMPIHQVRCFTTPAIKWNYSAAFPFSRAVVIIIVRTAAMLSSLECYFSRPRIETVIAAVLRTFLDLSLVLSGEKNEARYVF